MNLAIAKKQISRLSQMRGYPRNSDQEDALRELQLACASAASEETAKAVISSFLEASSADSYCPMPGDIRKALYDAQTAKASKPRCPVCDGTGVKVIPMLVTYRGPGTFAIKKTELLPTYELEDVREFAAKLGPNQAVLSATKPCVCSGGVL